MTSWSDERLVEAALSSEQDAIVYMFYKKVNEFFLFLHPMVTSQILLCLL